MKKIFDRLDADKDGKISAAEANAAGAQRAAQGRVRAYSVAEQ